MIFGPLVMIVFAVRAVGWLGGGAAGRGGAPDRNTALEVLSECSARGEIDREDYRRKKLDLS